MDEHQNNELDDFFRDSLRFYKEKPSGSLWTKIEDNLDKEDRAAHIASMRRRMLMTAGLLVVLTGLAIYSIQTVPAHKTLARQTQKAGIIPSGSLFNIQRFSNSVSINQIALSNDLNIRHNHPVTEHQNLYLRSWNPDISLLKDTGENDQLVISGLLLGSGISITQPVRSHDFPQRTSS